MTFLRLGAVCAFTLGLMLSTEQACAAGASQASKQTTPAISAHDRALRDKALSDYDAGRTAQALPVLLELATRYPGEEQLQAAAGMCLVESGDLAQGTGRLEQAHRLAPSDHDVARNLAIAYVKLGRPEQAIALAREEVTRSPHEFAAWLALGEALRGAGRRAEAEDAFERAAEHLPPNASEQAGFFYDWAATLLEENKLEPAAKVLARTPAAAADASTEELRAEIQERSGKYLESLDSFRHAAEMSPTEENIQAYAEELLRHWSFEPAATIARFGLQHFPESARLRLDLGVALFGNNDFQGAIEVFGPMLQQDPENAQLADLLGRSCSATVASAASPCDVLNTFAKSHPANAPALLYAAIALMRKPADDSTRADAETLLRSAVKANPKLAEAWYELGVLEQEKREWAASQADLEQAVRLRPMYSEAHYRLSRAYAHTGHKDEANAEIAVQRQTAEFAQQEERRRMEGVLTFLTAPQ